MRSVTLASLRSPPLFRIVVRPPMRIPKPELFIQSTLARLATILVLPLSINSCSLSLSKLASGPPMILPESSKTTTSPTSCSFKVIANLPLKSWVHEILRYLHAMPDFLHLGSFVPFDDDRRRDVDRRIDTGNNPDRHRERKAVDDFAAKEKQDEHHDKHGQ